MKITSKSKHYIDLNDGGGHDSEHEAEDGVGEALAGEEAGPMRGEHWPAVHQSQLTWW